MLESETERLRAERDDREAAARELLDLLQSSAADHDHDETLFARWPWLRPETKPGWRKWTREEMDAYAERMAVAMGPPPGGLLKRPWEKKER